jgi:hypothetical protein
MIDIPITTRMMVVRTLETIEEDLGPIVSSQIQSE